MSLCAMVLIASEFMPVSLLTPLAIDLNITEGLAGQSIGISGIFALLTSLFLTSLIGQVDRRKILLFFTFLLGVSGTIVTFAPNVLFFMLGRALLGVCVGGFWSMSAATLMRLVPTHSVPKALAILNGGNALATMIAAPLGSFLGSYIGWRGAFFCVVPFAAFAIIWQWMALPKLPAQTQFEKRAPLGHAFKLLGDRTVLVGMLATLFLFMGQFSLFTYLRPFLETTTGVSVEWLSLVLLIMGVSGLLGTFAMGHLLKRTLFLPLVLTPILMMAVALGLVMFGESLFAVVFLIAAWGLLGTSAPVAWWTWLSKTLPHEAEAGGGLMVGVIQTAIALGASIGGVFFDHIGLNSVFFFSAALLLVGAVLAAMATSNATNLVPKLNEG